MGYVKHTALALLATLLLLMSCNETNDNSRMETLYENIDVVDRADVIAYLQEKKYEYKLCNKGKTILVLKDSLYKIRMELATIRLPQFNGSEDLGEKIFANDIEFGNEDDEPPCPKHTNSSSTTGEKR